MNKPNLKAGALVVAGIMTVVTTPTRAASLVQNYSFETGTTAHFTTTGNPGVGTTTGTASNYGVVTNSGNYYLYLNNNYSSMNIGTMDNPIIVADPAENSAVAQTTATTAEAGDTITLSVEIGEPADGTLPASDYVGSLELVIGSTVVTNTLAETGTPNPGYLTATEGFTYAVQAGDVGKPIGVEVINPNNYGTGQGTVLYFDDIQLSQTPTVPEPSTWAMMLAGLLSLVGLRRIGRKQS